MKYLLDTSTFIWFVDGDKQLSQVARECIENERNELFISIVTLWEIVIKQTLGKLDFSADVQQMVFDIETMDAQLLGVEAEHLQSLESLTLPSDHKDPFDRLLISQAIANGLSVIGNDKKFLYYPVKLIW